MLAGHFTTALIANQRFSQGTLLYFLLASQLQDLLWFVLHYVGLEPTNPSDVLDTSLINMSVDMLYSHDLLPQIFWLVLIFGLGRLLFKSTQVALAGVAVVASHFILDLFSGHAHHVFGADSADIALGLYASNVYLAIAIEVAFCVVALLYFFNQESKKNIGRSRKNLAAVIGLFIFGIVFMLSIAKVSMREMLSLPEFEIGFNSSVPFLIISYLGMICWLNHFVPHIDSADE